MRCAIYCRLSREDEDKLSESESIQNQKSMLLQYAKEQQWEIYHIYSDEDYSGADRNRPDFNHMIQDAKKHCFDLILCKTQSRFTRDMELVERYLHSLFPLWGIRFVAIADHIDTSLQGNKKARQINGLVNEWYLEDLSENIRMVLNHKRRQGLYIGGFPLYGYQRHPTEKGRLIIDPTAASIVKQIFTWALEGCGKQQIADRLNQDGVPNPSRYKQQHGLGYVNGSMTDPRGIWSRTTVGRILGNEMYLGTMIQGIHRKLNYKSQKLLRVPKEEWFRVEGTHEAIIDKETFFSVQTLRKLRSRTDGNGEIHPLAGLVKCMSCGSTMQKNTYSYRGARYCYLRCPNKECVEKHNKNLTCSIRLDSLLLLIETQLFSYIRNWYCPSAPAKRLQTISLQAEKDTKQKITSITAQLEQHAAALKSLYVDKVSGFLTPEQFHDLSESFSQETEALRLRKKAYEERLSQKLNSKYNGTSPQESLKILMSNPIERALLLQLIHKIEVEGKNMETNQQTVKIHWKF